MENTLERIAVKGLYGNRTIDATLKDNTLILVGENGSGKTTFLRILFQVLSGRWLPLIQYRFDSISVSIAGKVYDISHESLSKSFEKVDRRFLSELPPNSRRRIMELIQSGEVDQIPMELERIRMRYGMPVEMVMSQLNLFEDSSLGLKKELQERVEKIRKEIGAQIIYLPTYRRIERELSSIYQGLDPEEYRRSKDRSVRSDTGNAYIELVEFGMKDVDKAIKSTLDMLRVFAHENLNKLTHGYLGDVLDQEYDNIKMKEITDTSEETIRGVLDSIDKRIMSEHDKENLFTVINAAKSTDSLDERTKIICHYFLKLLRFQESLRKRENQISGFCELCSEYIVDKVFEYDRANFNFSIIPKWAKNNEDKIDLSDLSSGEKQIVSLFSHLYLSGSKRYFVLIDEPELSLSVPWQRRFLTDIRNGGYCAGLVAVTHSPFIYDNELKKYAHSLGEFVSMGGFSG
jgi:energy-coupling factor transporter ATP-binding protein EcfA2